TDKMQLGLQALILRDNGYSCNEGIIYYRTTKQRVRLPITPELESWILQKIAEARRVITGPIPAPLVNSPKCVRCSLAPVCLPDETRMLGRESVERQSEERESVKRESVARLRPTSTSTAFRRDEPARQERDGEAAEDGDALRPGTGRGPGEEGAQGSETSQSLLTSAATSSTSPRRLIAARDDTRALYLNTPGLRIGCKEE